MSIGMLLISVELFMMLFILYSSRAIMRAPASLASRLAKAWAQRLCVLPAASSPRSPTLAPI
jgi:hypothetical protein